MTSMISNPEDGDYTRTVRYLLDCILPSYTGSTHGCTLESLGNGCTAFARRFGEGRFVLIITNGDGNARWRVLDKPELHVTAYPVEFLDGDEAVDPIYTTSTEVPLDWNEVDMAIDLAVHSTLALTR